MENVTLSKAKNGLSSFFSKITSGWEEGLSTVGREILPVWVANQLDLQSTDQLKNPTINQSWLPKKLTDEYQSIQNTMGAANDYARLKQPLFSIGGFEVNSLMLIGFAGALLVGYLVMK